MRGTILRAMPACLVAFATGCFMFSGSVAPPAAPRTETHAYWQKVNETLSRKPPSQDIKTMLQLVREQTEALRALSPEGVDPDLVAAVDEVVRCEEDVLEHAALADNNPETLKQNRGMAVLFAGSNKKAADAKKKLRALHEVLNSRHGGGFAVMGG